MKHTHPISTAGGGQPPPESAVTTAKPAPTPAPPSRGTRERGERTPAPPARERTIIEARATDPSAVLRVNQGVKLRRDYMQAMKILAATQDRLMYELMEEAVGDLLAKYGARPGRTDD